MIFFKFFIHNIFSETYSLHFFRNFQRKSEDIIGAYKEKAECGGSSED